jgi:hypothetical protein
MTKDEALKMAIETFEFEGVRNEEGLNVLNACKEALKQPAWRGLTEEEIQAIRIKTFDAVATNYEAYRAIEQALKEKNT